MYSIAHRFIVLAYMALPVGAVAWAIYRAVKVRAERQVALAGLGILFMAGTVIGAAASILYGVSLGGIAPVGQIALTSYFVIGLLCLLKLLDRGIDVIARGILMVGRGSFLPVERRALAMFMRAVVLFAVGLPYMVAAAMTFHPKVIVRVDSLWTQMGATEISFPSTDGLNIAGLWLAAGAAPPGKARPKWGQGTIILCHSQTGSKTSYPSLVQSLLSAGYNVLSFDFRGFGQSDGQLTTFGDRERYDVLGAVQWARTNYPERSRHIYGLGVGTGGAALIAAAGDSSPQGQSIESIVVCGCYDRFTALAASTASERFNFTPPLPWLMNNLGITLASLQTGTNLAEFSPASEAISISPRPIMFIHDRRDRIIPFELGVDLFDAAHAPKTCLWLEPQPNSPAYPPENAITTPGAVRAVRQFFELAVPMI